MNSKVANPKAIGYGVLAIGLWMFSIGPAQVVPSMGGGGAIQTIVTVAALGLLIAGIASFLLDDAWTAFFFLLWSGIFWGSAHGLGFTGLTGAWFLIAITLVNLYLWFGLFKRDDQRGSISGVVFLLWLSLLCLGLHGFVGFDVLSILGGAFGCASALAAFFVSATELSPAD